MKLPSSPTRSFLSTASAMALAAWCTSACTVYEAPPPRIAPRPVAVYAEPAPQQVVSVYVDPPLSQPMAVAVPWAPPPMLVEIPPPMPFPGAIWTGGYWVWNGDWVWAAGRWAPPPRPDYVWVHPYYENRDGMVVFINGHWSPPGVVFVPPPPGIRLTLAFVSPGARHGYAPIGPQGVFLPPPPGSRPGLIVPAPMGTPPAVVVNAPPVVNVGMRIQNNNSTVNNTRITNVTNVTNVTIVAPAGATSSGRPFSSNVPTQAPVAAAMPQGGRYAAPVPVNNRPVTMPTPGRPMGNSPEPQFVGNTPSGQPQPMPPRARFDNPAATSNPVTPVPEAAMAAPQHRIDPQAQVFQPTASRNAAAQPAGDGTDQERLRNRFLQRTAPVPAPAANAGSQDVPRREASVIRSAPPEERRHEGRAQEDAQAQARHEAEIRKRHPAGDKDKKDAKTE